MTAKRGDGRVLVRYGGFHIAYYAPVNGRSKEQRESVDRALGYRGGRHASREEADQLLARRLREVANHREGVRRFVGARSERVTVRELLEDVLADYELRKRKSTRTARSHMRSLADVIGAHRAASVNATLISRYVKSRRAQGRADTTIDRELELLRHAFRLAKDAGTVAFVPAIPRLTKPNDNARQGFLEPEQFGAVLRRIKNADFRDFLEWFWWTGMRPGEIGSLRWESYSRKANELRLRAADAKTGHARVVPLIEVLAPIIERRRAARSPACPLIFHSHGASLIKSTGGLHKWLYGAWQRACAAEELPDALPYDLRRTAIRNLLRLNVPVNTIMKISGHRTMSTFLRYAIVTTDDVADAFRKVGAAHAGALLRIDSRTKTRTGGAA